MDEPTEKELRDAIDYWRRLAERNNQMRLDVENGMVALSIDLENQQETARPDPAPNPAPNHATLDLSITLDMAPGFNTWVMAAAWVAELALDEWQIKVPSGGVCTVTARIDNVKIAPKDKADDTDAVG